MGGDLGAARLKQSAMFVATEETRGILAQASLNTQTLASAAAGGRSPWGVGGWLPPGSAMPGKKMSAAELRDELILTVVQGGRKMPLSSNVHQHGNDKENDEAQRRKRESRTLPPPFSYLVQLPLHMTAT